MDLIIGVGSILWRCLYLSLPILSSVTIHGHEMVISSRTRSPAVISTLSFTIQRDAYNHGLYWKIHGVALQMIYGGDKSSDHCGVFPLELISDGLYLMGLGFARILMARLWKQPPWKPPWRMQMGGDVDAVFIRESLPEPLCIPILSRRQVMFSYLFVWNQLTIFGTVGVLLCPALVLINDARSKNTSSRITTGSISSKKTFEKRKNIRCQSGKNMKSTLLSSTRIRTNWYRVDSPKHRMDALVFSWTIWKAKEAMPIRHTIRIKVRRIVKKKNNFDFLMFRL